MKPLVRMGSAPARCGRAAGYQLSGWPWRYRPQRRAQIGGLMFWWLGWAGLGPCLRISAPVTHGSWSEASAGL